MGLGEAHHALRDCIPTTPFEQLPENLTVIFDGLLFLFTGCVGPKDSNGNFDSMQVAMCAFNCI